MIELFGYNASVMSTPSTSILDALSVLPTEKAQEVLDFALFLKDRYAKGSDDIDDWSDEDMRDVALSAFRRFEECELEEERS